MRDRLAFRQAGLVIGNHPVSKNQLDFPFTGIVFFETFLKIDGLQSNWSPCAGLEFHA